jgi:hypothetical protein
VVKELLEKATTETQSHRESDFSCKAPAKMSSASFRAQQVQAEFLANETAGGLSLPSLWLDSLTTQGPNGLNIFENAQLACEMPLQTGDAKP